MTESKNITENVYKTICPGCSIGCGLYLRELYYENDLNSKKLSVDYRKSDSINEGKLCKFGVNLSKYYSNNIISEIEQNNIEEIANVLKKYNGNEIEFLNIGNTTNEEHLAFMELAKLSESKVNTLTSDIYKKLENLHSLANSNIIYDQIPQYKRIYVFSDILIQYPMITRYLLKAKNNGSEIISLGIKSQSFSSNHLFINPNDSLYDIPNFICDKETLIISDITIYTNIKLLAEILEISNSSNSNLLFLKPFVNSNGVELLSRHTKQKSLNEILSLIDNGTIKVLVCLESDIAWIHLEPEIEKILMKLDHFIVFSSKKTKTYDIATIKMKIDPFYKRYGTIINSEKRLISQYLMNNLDKKENTLFDIIEQLIEKMNGNKKTLIEVEEEIISMFNINESEINKDMFISLLNKKEKKDIKNVSTNISVTCLEKEDNMIVHVYSFSPYFWLSTNEFEDFIEIGRNQLHSLNILKSNTIDISCACNGSKVVSKYKISNIKDGYAISWNKKTFSKKPVSFISINKKE